MDMFCLDVEGVLLPEIWINVAEHYRIDELKATTRDVSDYDVLMRQRLRILDEYGITLPHIQQIIAAMGPFNMLDWVMLNAPIGAVLTIPVLVYLYTPDVADTTYTTAALIIGSLIAFPLYIYGTIQGNDGYRLGGLVGALVVTAVLVYVIPSLRRDKSAPVAN